MSSGEIEPAESAPSSDDQLRMDQEEKAAKTERKWKWTFACLVLAIIAVVVAAAVVGTQNKNDSSSSETTEEEEDLSPTYSPPTPAPVNNTQAQLDILLEALISTEYTMKYFEQLPTDPALLEGIALDDTSQAPVVRAAAWVVHDDKANRPDHLVPRLALATLYLSLEGPEWKNSTHWLTDQPLCHLDQSQAWYGVHCDHLGAVHELDLTNNNLQGTIPDILALLTDLGGLWLDQNALSGDIPIDMLESLPNLELVYLEGNDFTNVDDLPDNTRFVVNGVDEMFPHHGQPFPP